MPIPAAMFTADLAVVATDIQQTLTFGGVTRRAVIGDIGRSREGLEAGGFVPLADCEVHLFVADWTTLPTPGSRVTIGGTAYRVERTATDPGGVSFRLFLATVQP